MKVSFVIPVCDERESLTALVAGILEHAAPHEPEIVLVDDGSTDGSADVLAELAARHASVKVVRFRCNAGKTAALAAGFARADGDVVFTMDGDLQDDPKEIPRFLERLQEGDDLVCGWKAHRHDPWHKTIPSKIYNCFVAWLFGLELHDVNCGFKAMRGKVAKALSLYADMHRLIPVLAADLGYSTTEIMVEHQPRRSGKSKYGLERFSHGAVDVLKLWVLRRGGGSPGTFFGKRGRAALLLGAAFLGVGLVAGRLVQSVGLLLVCGVAACGLGAAGAIGVRLGRIGESALRERAAMDPEQYVISEEGRP